MSTRTTLAMIIFAVLILVSVSSIAATFTTHLSAMTMQPGNQTTTMMNKNMSSGNMTSGGSNMTK